jgi:hypothetical protein
MGEGSTRQYSPHVLREYALLADGERGALIGPRGDCSWLCAPGFADPALFGALVGAPGCYEVTPQDRFVWGGYYETGSLIWRNRWITTSGIVECREALAMPADPGRLVLLRQVIAREGPARLRVVLDLAADFGRYRVRDLHSDDGRWTGRLGELYFRWDGGSGAVPQGDHDSVLHLDLELPEGDTHDLVLEVSRRPLGDPVRPSAAWAATRQAWDERVPNLPAVEGERDARHAAAVLHGLTSGGGGMVAAVTTSLPERAEEGRNYDYRYVWIRDQCYAGCAAAEVGLTSLLDAAVHFVGDRLRYDGSKLKPAYTVDGRDVPSQRQLDLPGYPGGTVVVGNHVNAQFQLDTFGEALQLFASAARGDRLDRDGWRAAEIAADGIADTWGEPEAGIWELDDRIWTQSRLACVAGLRAMAKVAPGGGRAAEWLSLADTILAEVASTGVHSTGRWQRAADDERLDAALLLPALRGAIPADDPRHLATLEAIRSDLTQDGYLYRFRHDSRPLSDAEGAFLICGYWMSEALSQQGRQVDAARWFERTRAACGPPGLQTEEFDVGQRQLRGNLPQAFVHAELLRAGRQLARTATD